MRFKRFFSAGWIKLQSCVDSLHLQPWAAIPASYQQETQQGQKCLACIYMHMHHMHMHMHSHMHPLQTILKLIEDAY